jgi:HSP20 family molecular chaperone IbpA
MSRSEYFGRHGLGPLEDLSHDMERVFDSLLGRTVGTMLRSGAADKFVPALDVAESSDAFTVSVDLPGVDPDQVKIEMQDGKLTIAGTRAGISEENRANYHRVERGSGAFQRVVNLPGEVELERIEEEDYGTGRLGAVFIWLRRTLKHENGIYLQCKRARGEFCNGCLLSRGRIFTGASSP